MNQSFFPVYTLLVGVPLITIDLLVTPLPLLAQTGTTDTTTELTTETSADLNAITDTIEAGLDVEYENPIDLGLEGLLGPDTSLPEASSEVIPGEPLTTPTAESSSEASSEEDTLDTSTVRSLEDLREYATTAATQNNENVTTIEVASDEAITVHHKQLSRILGFIPVTMQVKTQLATDGSAAVTLPWWHFLASKPNFDARRLEFQINNDSIVSRIKAQATTTVRAQALERILELIKN